MKHNAGSTTSPTSVDENNKEGSSKPWEPDFSKATKEITNEAVEGTVFRIVGNEEIGYRATFGNIYISEPHTTIQELTKKIKNKDWSIIMSVMSALLMINDEYKKEEL